jgi:phosphoribosylformylglycinamidine synthase I
MKVAVIQFPGSNCDLDTLHVLRDVVKIEADLIWHKNFKDSNYDAAILPGGFSYGDHLRAGIIAAYSPAMTPIKEMAKENKPILGICNGFQILVESSLLPGALLRNSGLKFVCKWTRLRVETEHSAFTRLYQKGQNIRMPIAHNEGRYFIEEETLKDLRRNDQIVFRYVSENPNGAIDDIAGICNEDRNVVGLMPHPERASENILGSEDGRKMFESMLQWLN